MPDRDSTPYHHVQLELQASNLLWDGQLFNTAPIRQEWATGVIHALLVLGGTEIQYIESDLDIDSSPFGSTANVWAFTRTRVIRIEASVSASDNGPRIDMAARTFPRSDIRSIEITALEGDFDATPYAVSAIRLLVHFKDRSSIDLGVPGRSSSALTRSRAGSLTDLLETLKADLDG